MDVDEDEEEEEEEEEAYFSDIPTDEAPDSDYDVRQNDTKVRHKTNRYAYV